MSDFLVPLLIVVACLLLAVFAHFLRRPSPSRSDIVAPEMTPARKVRRKTTVDAEPVAEKSEDQVSRSALAAWHSTHESSVLTFVEDHEDRLFDDDGFLDEIYEDEMSVAIADHPSTVMSAELSALQVAATATVRSLRRGSSEGAEQHHATYTAYREQWLDRLWQFAQDRDRVRQVRAAPIPELTVPDIDDTAESNDDDLDESVDEELTKKSEQDATDELSTDAGDDDETEGVPVVALAAAGAGALAADDKERQVMDWFTDDDEAPDPEDIDGPLPPVDPQADDPEPTGRHAAIKTSGDSTETDRGEADGDDATDEVTTNASSGRLARFFGRASK